MGSVFFVPVELRAEECHSFPRAVYQALLVISGPPQVLVRGLLCSEPVQVAVLPAFVAGEKEVHFVELRAVFRGRFLALVLKMCV